MSLKFRALPSQLISSENIFNEVLVYIFLQVKTLYLMLSAIFYFGRRFAFASTSVSLTCNKIHTELMANPEQASNYSNKSKGGYKQLHPSGLPEPLFRTVHALSTIKIEQNFLRGGSAGS